MIGNGGDSPNGSGGMIPSTGPPFAMTRWVAQTRQNYVSVTPYNSTDEYVHGFQGTHQPAIWMGESGQVVIMPGITGDRMQIKTSFEERGMRMDKETELSTPSYYRLRSFDNRDNVVVTEQSSSELVG
jgi:putative alpha-1,2-mannosidase